MRRAIVVSMVFLMTGCAFAEEFTNYSLYGMAVESASGDASEVIVTTTGATYVLGRIGLDMYRKIDPATNAVDGANGGKGRLVAHLTFAYDIGALSIQSDVDALAVIQSDKATFQFLPDSFFIITAKDNFTYTHTSLITNAPYNAPLKVGQRGLERLWTDGYGGSLHATMEANKAPVLASTDVDFTTFSMADGNVMAHMVFPPKLFNFEGLYGGSAHPYIGRILEDTVKDSDANIDSYMASLHDLQRVGTVLIAIELYDNSYHPVLLDSNVMGYRFKTNYLTKLAYAINSAHNNDLNVIGYTYSPTPSETDWVYPVGHPLAGQKQSSALTLEWMRTHQNTYHLDGWYFDNASQSYTSLIEDYNFMRQVRTDIGDANVIFHHDSVDVWDDYPNYRGLRAIMVDAWVDYTLVGETGIYLTGPNDPYLRYFASGYGMSQAYGDSLRDEYHKSPMALMEIWRTMTENLNGCGGCFAAAFSAAKPYYDLRKTQYVASPDVNWPVNGTTGWFRYASDVDVNVSSTNSSGDVNVAIKWTTPLATDSSVFYAIKTADGNALWWSTAYQDIPVNPAVGSSDKVTNHSVTLSDLRPRTYKFKIKSRNLEPNEQEIIWSYTGTFTVGPRRHDHRHDFDGL
jgi:hypothetical protein